MPAEKTNTWSPPAWSTAMPVKRELYGADTYFIEAWQDLLAELGVDARHFGLTHTYILIKPESALVGAAVELASWFARHDWEILACRAISVNRYQLRGLWYYHWNSVTRHHRDVVDLLFGAAPSVFLLLRSTRSDEQNASARLAKEKGPADPARQADGHLRREFGGYNSYLNLVHSPDEPADLIRELAVLFDSNDRRQLCAPGRQVVPDPAVRSVIADAVPDVPLRCGSLHLDDLADYLSKRCAAHGGAGAEVAATVTAIANDPAARPFDWHRLRRDIALIDEELAASFEFVAYATYLTTAQENGYTRAIPTIRAGSVG